MHEEHIYHCDLCPYTSRRKDYIKLHKDAKHFGLRFPCDECDYVANFPGDLKKHKSNKHIVGDDAEAIIAARKAKHKCDQCVASFKRSGDLLKHKMQKHEGLRYSCDLCQKLFTTTSSLYKHKRKIHNLQFSFERGWCGIGQVIMQCLKWTLLFGAYLYLIVFTGSHARSVPYFPT